MIGSLDIDSKKVVIVGAGISGLLCGFYLKKHGFHVSILEKSERPGGLIKTSIKYDTKFEHAAHIFKLTPELAKICKELGVAIDIISVKRRLFLLKNKLRSFPLNPMDVIELTIRMLVLQKKKEYNSLEDFCNYHLGKNTTRKAITAVMNGIYAVHPSILCAKVMFRKYQESDAKIPLLFWFLRNKKKHKEPLATIRGGAEKLVLSLAEFLKDEIQYNTTVSSISDIKCDNVVVTVPSFVASGLLTQENLIVSQLLDQIKYTNITHLWSFYDPDAFQSIKASIGFLSSDGGNLLGTLFNGFYSKDDSDRYFLTTSLFTSKESAPYKTYLPLEPLKTEVNETKNAIPIYSNDLFRIAKELCDIKISSTKNIVICGNYLGSLSVSQIIDDILQNLVKV
jgi:protoporphyrinogen oxidase